MGWKHFLWPRLSRRMEFFLYEGLAGLFGWAAASVASSEPVARLTLGLCVAGIMLSLAMMFQLRCDRCHKRMGAGMKELVSIPESHCAKCGTALG